LTVGERKLYLRGVTYGTFRPDDDGCDYPSPDVVGRDFSLMAGNGLNAVRTYTPPPCWLLDAALQEGLYVMVGLPWEQHVAFLDGSDRAASIEKRVREGVRACAGHPAVLCYAVGNEIPAPIARWHGKRRIERWIHRLYDAAKDEDPDGLVTYVNYPSTEYLELPFLDLMAFNVYLEKEDALERYLARLQNIAGDRPLLMAEIGLDSRRNGELEQALTLRWQLQASARAGCAGTFVFAWTDEWHRGGHDIDDWDFGLTTRERLPKPALTAVREAFAASPVPVDPEWPRMSVVVCTYNGAATLEDCLDGLAAVDYPNYEVVVIDDGSTDESAAICLQRDVRVVSTENRGLAEARNTGMHHATGEILAYVDDDARPDPDWLSYLAQSFTATTHAAVGGPNLPPAGDGAVAECVAHAPGGPTHVLLDDAVAEHIPGCNMAIRKSCLEEIGGFDPQFRAAGDDVDLCWRLQDRGWTVGYNHAATVWHHRRDSVRAYWKQQRGYGRAEALIERKWPEKYNGVGHLSWAGRIYGDGLLRPLGRRTGRVFHGTWGSALFQSLYQRPPGTAGSLLLMPEWYLVVSALAVLSTLGLFWSPLLGFAPVLAGAVLALVAQAGASAAHPSRVDEPRSAVSRAYLRALTAALYLMQPIARLTGRIGHGLSPWRRPPRAGWALPRICTSTAWSEQWESLDDRLRGIEGDLIASGAAVRSGGDFDRWDLDVRGGVLASCRMRLTVEEHGGGKQLIRLRSWPRLSWVGTAGVLLFALLAAAAAVYDGWFTAVVLGTVAFVIGARIIEEAAAATGWVFRPHSGAPMLRRSRNRRVYSR
jgi:GT2 family glycosyltransferase